MTEQSNTPNPVDSENQNTSPVDESSNKKDDFVAYSSHVKLLEEKKKLQAKHAESLARLAEYEAKDKDTAEKKLLEEKKYQELIQSKENELLETKNILSQMKEEKEDYAKMHAFVSGLGEAKLDPKYYSLVPLEQIKLTDDGAIDVESLNETVKSFVNDHPRLLITTKNSLPATKVGGSTGTKLSLKEWRSLGSSKEMMKRYHEVDFSKD